jgi:hypothetical protein
VKPIPFEFVLEWLDELAPYTNPMFGCTAVYVGNKIVFILRDRGNSPPDDGVWIATTAEHHESLRRDLPSMRDIEIFGPGPTGWQVLPVSSGDFEESVRLACDFVLRGDERIGKIPKSRLRSGKRKSSKKKDSKKTSMKPSKRTMTKK